MLQNHVRVKDPSKEERVRQILIYKYKEFIDTILDSVLQLTFKKLPLVLFWCHINKGYLQLPEKDMKVLIFLTKYLYETSIVQPKYIVTD